MSPGSRFEPAGVLCLDPWLRDLTVAAAAVACPASRMSKQMCKFQAFPRFTRFIARLVGPPRRLLAKFPKNPPYLLCP